MDVPVHADLARDLIEVATSFGATLAGLTTAADLEKAPSRSAWSGKAVFPTSGTVLVMALVHSAANPALDWWDGPSGGTPGNRQLLGISRQVADWLSLNYRIDSRELAYAPEQGGVFLKDAATLAGLGTIGRNNLLITPQFGPRIRLRALLIDADLSPTAPPLAYFPCDDCDKPCFQACPRHAFDSEAYCREDCLSKMNEDESVSLLAAEEEGTLIVITYCRECEMSCPVGKDV